MALDRAEGLQQIRDFTRGATKLVVIDRYAYAGQSQYSNEYVGEFAKAARTGPQLKALHIVYSSSKSNTRSIRRGIARAARKAGTALTDHDYDLIYDRIWIADR